jgi:hypothetical protein
MSGFARYEGTGHMPPKAADQPPGSEPPTAPPGPVPLLREPSPERSPRDLRPALIIAAAGFALIGLSRFVGWPTFDESISRARVAIVIEAIGYVTLGVAALVAALQSGV